MSVKKIIHPPMLCALALAVTGASAAHSADDTEARIAELERQVRQLTELMAKQDSSIKVTTERLDTDEKQLASAVDVAGEAHTTRMGTKLSYGGFVKVDSMVSHFSDGKPTNTLIEDFMVPSLVPTSDGSGSSYQSYNMHSKTSRFFLKTATKTDVGLISTNFEMDFAVGGQGNERVSNSWANRMRHAYVRWDYAPNASLLAGQTWSTFFNVATLPANLDFVGPVGTIFNRQPMIRWTTGPWMFAAENPRTRFQNEPHDDFSEGIPDLVARYNGQSGDLAWTVAGIARQLTYDNGVTDDSTIGYGLSVSGKWMLGADDIRFMANYGDALGRYLGVNAFNDGFVGTDGAVEKFDQMGAFFAYRHSFDDNWSGGFTLSMAEADNPSMSEYAGADLMAKRYHTGHLNLIYSPTARFSIGGELVYGSKELENGNDGTLNRFLMSVKYGI
ncbi:MAG: DcaP family trimeric outer membrane transporter [Halieaceae bacterium]|jgi:hypothetical protein|nr:DcaP family trimeric outer membrane transporter [Halieaceae bacterium]